MRFTVRHQLSSCFRHLKKGDVNSVEQIDHLHSVVFLLDTITLYLRSLTIYQLQLNTYIGNFVEKKNTTDCSPAVAIQYFSHPLYHLSVELDHHGSITKQMSFRCCGILSIAETLTGLCICVPGVSVSGIVTDTAEGLKKKTINTICVWKDYTSDLF